MLRPQVIANKYLPTKPVSIFHWATIITCLHYWGAPGWAWGVVCTVYGIFTVITWIACVCEELRAPGKIVKR